MEGMGRHQLLHFFLQNYHFHYRRVETLEHVIVLFVYNSDILHITVSLPYGLFLPYGCHIIFYMVFLWVHFHNFSTLRSNDRAAHRR